MSVGLIYKSIFIFIFSIGNDWLSIKWHECREKNNAWAGVLFAVLLGLIGWLSFIWVVKVNILLAIPDLIGTAVGSYFGIKHYKAPLPVAIAVGSVNKPGDKND